MRLFRLALCAVLIAMTPLAAEARWGSHGGRHEHARGYRWRPYRHRPYHYRYRYRAPKLSDGRANLNPYCEFQLRDARGRFTRCSADRAAFEKDNPCPSTGLPTGPCPGYVVDHIVPLKRGGSDDPSNMQWQTVEDAKAKDKVE